MDSAIDCHAAASRTGGEAEGGVRVVSADGAAEAGGADAALRADRDQGRARVDAGSLPARVRPICPAFRSTRDALTAARPGPCSPAAEPGWGSTDRRSHPTAAR